MRTHLALGFSVLLLAQAGCIIIADGQRTARRTGSNLIKLCGPRPPRQVVEQLVSAECGNLQSFELHCSTPVRRRATGLDGTPFYGWYVAADLTTRSSHGPLQIHVEKRSYMIHKRRHGFAIIAHGTNHLDDVGQPRVRWQRRNLVAIDNQLALIQKQKEMARQLERQRQQIEAQKRLITEHRQKGLQKKLREMEQSKRQDLARRQKQERDRRFQERRREWEIMTTRPNAKEREVADPGPCPKGHEQTIRGRLKKTLAGHYNVNMTIYAPSKTWGRTVGSAQLVWGWSVRVRVRSKKKGDRPETHFYYFMFRGEQIVSTERSGLGYRVVARKSEKVGKLGKPGKAGKPEQTGKPGKPGKLKKVGKPVAPAHPGKPAKPEKPAKPGKPARPATPGK
ncbi:MAG: hypothetical protein ACYTGW_04335 [Planctomycetota bacterium]|jgi:hypothetical protein